MVPYSGTRYYLGPHSISPTSRKPRDGSVFQDPSTRNKLSGVGTQHSFRRVAAETPLTLLIAILCQACEPEVTLQYASDHGCQPSHRCHPVPDPFSGAFLAFERGPESSLSTLCCNGQITLQKQSLVRYLRKKATFAKAFVRG